MLNRYKVKPGHESSLPVDERTMYLMNSCVPFNNSDNRTESRRRKQANSNIHELPCFEICKTQSYRLSLGYVATSVQRSC